MRARTMMLGTVTTAEDAASFRRPLIRRAGRIRNWRPSDPQSDALTKPRHGPYVAV